MTILLTYQHATARFISSRVEDIDRRKSAAHAQEPLHGAPWPTRLCFADGVDHMKTVLASLACLAISTDCAAAPSSDGIVRHDAVIDVESGQIRHDQAVV